jgi:5-methylcytosine-specific restriction endonuclease McrA
VSNICAICGDHEVYHQYPLLDERATVCGECAGVVANVYWKAHAGRWLTWKNPPSVDRRKPKIPQQLRWEVFKRDGYTCCECGAHGDLTCDHIEAESKGGPTTLENLRTLCRSCNSKKGAR